MGIWTMSISSNVYNRILNDFFKDSLQKYGMTAHQTGNYIWCENFTTSQISDSSDLKFPAISIIELPGAERGQDLEGTSINAALFTFQIDVIHNEKESVAQKCMGDIVQIMKSMRFSVNTMPSFDSKPQEYRMTARFQRLIGSGDFL